MSAVCMYSISREPKTPAVKSFSINSPAESAAASRSMTNVGACCCRVRPFGHVSTIAPVAPPRCPIPLGYPMPPIKESTGQMQSVSDIGRDPSDAYMIRMFPSSIFFLLLILHACKTKSINGWTTQARDYFLAFA
jgi:hypothetical protein